MCGLDIMLTPILDFRDEHNYGKRNFLNIYQIRTIDYPKVDCSMGYKNSGLKPKLN